MIKYLKWLIFLDDKHPSLITIVKTNTISLPEDQSKLEINNTNSAALSINSNQISKKRNNNYGTKSLIKSNSEEALFKSALKSIPNLLPNKYNFNL